MSGKVITKPFPLTIPTTNIGIASIAIHATSAHGILFEVKAFGIRHSINDLSQRPNLRTPWTYQTTNSLASLCCHKNRLEVGTDKSLLEEKNRIATLKQ